MYSELASMLHQDYLKDYHNYVDPVGTSPTARVIATAAAGGSGGKYAVSRRAVLADTTAHLLSTSPHGSPTTPFPASAETAVLKLRQPASTPSTPQQVVSGRCFGEGQSSSRYKTELCRPFEESGRCRYGDKCQFAHGRHELRSLSRHPKYKTDLCRTFHTSGYCPYGSRCHFVHNSDEQRHVPAVRASSTVADDSLWSYYGGGSVGGLFPSSPSPVESVLSCELETLSLGSAGAGGGGDSCSSSPPPPLSPTPCASLPVFSRLRQATTL